MPSKIFKIILMGIILFILIIMSILYFATRTEYPNFDKCGNGDCEQSEDSINCPEDCLICGDGRCDLGESCSTDCGIEPPEEYCGDGICQSYELDEENCNEDCGTDIVQIRGIPQEGCGDGICQSYENGYICEDDCGLPLPICGDGKCEIYSNDITIDEKDVCPEDCCPTQWINKPSECCKIACQDKRCVEKVEDCGVCGCQNTFCNYNSDCCQSPSCGLNPSFKLECFNNKCTQIGCVEYGGMCSSQFKCCKGLDCQDSRCYPPPLEEIDNNNLIYQLNQKQRPLVGSIAIRVPIKDYYGLCTLGIIVSYNRENYILTAGHCVAENMLMPDYSDIGREVNQGGKTSTDAIGKSYKIDNNKQIDISLIKLYGGVESTPMELFTGHKIDGFGEVYENQEVFMIGRTSGILIGKVKFCPTCSKKLSTTRNKDWVILFNGNKGENEIFAVDFNCQKGDSGSPIITLEKPHRLVGIISSEFTHGNIFYKKEYCDSYMIEDIKNTLGL